LVTDNSFCPGNEKECPFIETLRQVVVSFLLTGFTNFQVTVGYQSFDKAEGQRQFSAYLNNRNPRVISEKCLKGTILGPALRGAVGAKELFS